MRLNAKQKIGAAMGAGRVEFQNRDAYVRQRGTRDFIPTVTLTYVEFDMRSITACNACYM